MNAWLKSYADETDAIYADYLTALYDGKSLKAAWAYDGVHPNEAGYRVMAPIADRGVRAALSAPAPQAAR